MMCKGECYKSRLCPFSLGFALGAAKGLFLLLLAWTGWLAGYGIAMIDHISSFFSGYGASLVGGLYGLVLGFVCGFIFGFFIGCFYNFCCCRCCKKSAENKDSK